MKDPMGDRFRRRLDPFRTCESRERTRSRTPPGSDSIVTRSCKTVGPTTRSRRSTRTRSRSLSRRATSFETARSCTSRHQPVAPPVLALMCSRAARFIGGHDRPSLFGGQQAGKGTGLPQPRGLLARGAQQRDHLRERRRVEYPAPFVESGRRVPLEPALQVSPRHVEQLRVRLERGCDCLVQGQAALLYPLVAAHANSMVALLAFPAEPTFAPGEGPAQGAAILIRT